MIGLNPSRLLLPALLAAATAVLAGCGGSAVDPGSSAVGPTTSAPPTTTAATPVPTPTTTRPAPSKAATTAADQGGDGDAEGDNAPSTKGGGICRYVGAAEVGAVVGTTMTGSAVPGQTGCKFDQGGRSGMSVTLLDKSTSAAGGMTGAKAEANSAVEGTPENVPGIGSAAFVVTGSMFGGPDVNAAGAVQVGGRIVSVFLVQHSGLAEAKVRALELDLLRLVVKESP